MPNVEVGPGANRGWALDAHAADPRRKADPLVRVLIERRARRMLSDLLAGLNQLLKLSDFSRGDVFRN